jgi:hypothetical protein
MLLVVREEHHLLYEMLGVIRISRLKFTVWCHDVMKVIHSLDRFSSSSTVYNEMVFQKVGVENFHVVIRHWFLLPEDSTR